MRILLAVSERDLLECYKLLLEGEGMEVLTAFDGAQALAIATTKRPDAVVLDVHLPRVDHLTLVRRLKNNDIPVLILSDSPEDREKLRLKATADTVLIHPFQPSDLLTMLRHLSGRKPEDAGR